MDSARQAAEGAKRASFGLANISIGARNEALSSVARALQEHKDQIIQANDMDVEDAKRQNLMPPLLKRLRYDASKVEE